jgi:hypothetical protein
VPLRWLGGPFLAAQQAHACASSRASLTQRRVLECWRRACRLTLGDAVGDVRAAAYAQLAGEAAGPGEPPGPDGGAGAPAARAAAAAALFAAAGDEPAAMLALAALGALDAAARGAAAAAAGPAPPAAAAAALADAAALGAAYPGSDYCAALAAARAARLQTAARLRPSALAALNTREPCRAWLLPWLRRCGVVVLVLLLPSCCRVWDVSWLCRICPLTGS